MSLPIVNKQQTSQQELFESLSLVMMTMPHGLITRGRNQDISPMTSFFFWQYPLSSEQIPTNTPPLALCILESLPMVLNSVPYIFKFLWVCKIHLLP